MLGSQRPAEWLVVSRRAAWQCDPEAPPRRALTVEVEFRLRNPTPVRDLEQDSDSGPDRQDRAHLRALFQRWTGHKAPP